MYWRMTLGIDGLVGLGHGEVGRVHGGACGSLDVNDLGSLVAVADTGFVTTHDEQDHVEETKEKQRVSSVREAEILVKAYISMMPMPKMAR